MNRKAAQLSRRRKKERISVSIPLNTSCPAAVAWVVCSLTLDAQELEQSVIQLSRKNHELKVINDTLRVLLQKRSQQQCMKAAFLHMISLTWLR